MEPGGKEHLNLLGKIGGNTCAESWTTIKDDWVFVTWVTTQHSRVGSMYTMTWRHERGNGLRKYKDINIVGT